MGSKQGVIHNFVQMVRSLHEDEISAKTGKK